MIKNTDFGDKRTWAYKFRKKRFDFFELFFSRVIVNRDHMMDHKYNILDVGGTEKYWITMGFTREKSSIITLLNLEKKELIDNDNLKSVVGDATNMGEYENNSFDLAFSNSVIEHVGDYRSQKKMANEIRRIAKHYYLQTPNKYFFMEPHFVFPYFQLLPCRIQVFLLTHFSLGCMSKAKTYQEAKKMANSIRLLSKKELRKLFPEATMKKEIFFGMTKSFVLYY